MWATVLRWGSLVPSVPPPMTLHVHMASLTIRERPMPNQPLCALAIPASQAQTEHPSCDTLLLTPPWSHKRMSAMLLVSQEQNSPGILYPFNSGCSQSRRELSRNRASHREWGHSSFFRDWLGFCLVSWCNGCIPSLVKVFHLGPWTMIRVDRDYLADPLHFSRKES
jgi:hypothetical protein